MITLEQFLVVALIVMLGVIVVCGVVAVVLLKRALDVEKQNQEPSNRESTMVAGLDEQARRLNEAMLRASQARSEAAGSVANAYSRIVALEQMAVRTQSEEAEEAYERVFETFSQYGAVYRRQQDTPRTEMLEVSLTQEDVERRVGRGNGHPQTA